MDDDIPTDRTEIGPLDDSLIDPPYLYADTPWWHKPTEGERITDGFAMIGDGDD